ncbi:MAG: hypothetical protein ACI9VR_004786, partial [Cognaticolwellia sp.]
RGALDQIQQSHQAAYQAIRTQAQRRALRTELVGADAVDKAAQLLLQKARDFSDVQQASQARAKAEDLVS